MNISSALRRAAVAAPLLGLVFATAAFANQQSFSTNKAWSSCNESLCIDAPPEGPQ